MMLKKNVHRGPLFYNTWVPLVLLYVNTIVSRCFDSPKERFGNKILLVERSSSENKIVGLYFSYIVPMSEKIFTHLHLQMTMSLALSSMHLCDFASVSQPPTLLQPRPQGWLLGCGGLASF